MRILLSVLLPVLLLSACTVPAPQSDDDDDDATTPEGPQVVTLDPGDSVVQRQDGTWDFRDGWAFQDWPRAFYEQHGDDYDVLLFFTDFRVADIWQFCWTAKIDVDGTGIAEQNELWYGEGLGADYTADVGSAGRLQASIVMNTLDLFDQSWLTAQDILTHEVGHRWGMSFRLEDHEDPTVLYQGNSHWTLVLGQDGPSAMQYGQTREIAPGRFRSERVQPMPYGPFDLYLMGLLPLDEVGPLFYVDEPTNFSAPADPGESVPATPTEFDGTRVELTPADIVASMGPRVPAVEDAQKDFRMAFVLVCAPGEPCDPDMLARVEAERLAWSETFSWATRGLGSVDTTIE